MRDLFTKQSIPILVFVLVAISLSAAMRYLTGNLYEPNQQTLLSKALFMSVLVGWGVAVAAIISWKVFGRQGKTSSLTGSWTAGAILVATMPSMVFAVFGYPNQYGVNPHLAGLLFGLLFLLYALGEEIGWRGYMHDALGPRPVWLRGILIAIVWWLWHMWFMRENVQVQFLIMSAIIIIPVSILFSQLISESQSWLATAGFHSVGNIAFMAGMLEMESQTRFTIAGIALLIMIAIHTKWKKRQPALSISNNS